MKDTQRTYDLHCHSTASDGSLDPTTLVERAAAHGVDVLALTDHDVLDGLEEAAVAAKRCGLTLINGVEISVTWGSSVIHIVGLGIDPRTPELRAGLRGIRRQREWRAGEIGLRLARAGIQGATAGARRLAGGRIVSRTHFARFLVEQGYAADIQSAFRRYLKPGRPGYVKCDWVALDEALAWISASGGQAVIAHPARYNLSRTRLQALIADFVAVGGCALEVVTSSHTPADCRLMAQFASQYDLLGSMGSDFHCPDLGWAELGRVAPLPAGITPIWHDWRLPESPNMDQTTDDLIPLANV